MVIRGAHPKPLATRTSRTRRRAVPAVALAAIMALVASCSSGGDDSDAGSAGPSVKAQAAKANDIVVGGFQDGNYAGMDVGFNARIARFNKEGGINGRNVRSLGVVKDGTSLAGNLSAVQSLVLKKKVFAVTPFASSTFNPASAELINKNNLPFIGWGILPAACLGAGAFPILGCQASPEYSSKIGVEQLSKALDKPAGDLKIAIIGFDDAGAKGGVALATATNKLAGADVVYSKASIPQGGTSDYSPYTQAILGENPNVVQLLTDFSAGAALTGALRQAGYKGAIVNPTAYLPGVLSSQKQLAAALQGSLVVANYPSQEEGSAASKQIVADLKASGASPNLTLGTSIGWWSAEQFVQELKATAAAGPLTSANFVKTVRAGFTLKSLEGGISDVAFPQSQTRPANCSGLMSVQPDGTFKVAAKYACDPAAAVKVGG